MAAHLRVEERIAAPLDGAGRLDLTPLVGTWINCDKGASGGILRMVVSAPADDLVLQVFGAGSPEPYDWGEVVAQPHSNAVNSTQAWAFVASYDTPTAETSLFAYTKTGILVQTSYCVFRDGSGRADFWTREFFYREGA